MDYVTLADDFDTTSATQQHFAPSGSHQTSLQPPAELCGAQNGNNIMLVEPMAVQELADNEASSGTIDKSAALMRAKARSPIAIGSGIAAAAAIGYKLHPSSKRRFRPTKAKIVTASAAVAGGIVAHGLASYLLMRFGK